jgi:hypothetical protein
MHRTIHAAIAALFLAAPLAAQTTLSTDDTFKWSGKIPAGAWLKVANMNGSINVQQASGDVAEITGDKDWHRGDPKDVRFAVVKDGDNITVCALWGEESTCDARGAHYHHHGWDGDHNDVNVKFTVKLPKGVKLDASTVNGSLDVSGATGEVEASTVNGRVDVATGGGPVNATTVNGSIRVSMQAAPGNSDLRFKTVNGSIVVTVPANLSAELEMETVNGSLTSDFPLTITGKVNPRHLRATIGSGGRHVELTTVNGSVELRKTG